LGEKQDWTECVNWVIYPVLNPDGYVNSWQSDRFWRKNMNTNNGHNCKGVDLNRNYDAEWMHGGTSTNPCSQEGFTNMLLFFIKTNKFRE
jgi:murein tripeptide amidase MpaA